MSKNTLSRIAILIAILAGLFGLANQASAAGPTLSVTLRTEVHPYAFPGQVETAHLDKISGAQTVDMFATVDVQQDGDFKNDDVWLRVGDGTQDYHSKSGQKWVAYRWINESVLKEIYGLPHLSFSVEQRGLFKIQLWTVEEKVSYILPDGHDQFITMTGDLNARPEYLLDLRIPLDRIADLRLYAEHGAGSCKARLNGGEHELKPDSDLPIYNGVFRIVGGTCAIYSTADKGIEIHGVKRSFSGVYLQANMGGSFIAILAGLLVFAIVMRKKFAIARIQIPSNHIGMLIVILFVGALIFGTTGTALAGPGGPGGTPTPTGPAPTVTPSPEITPEGTETPTPEATVEVTATETVTGPIELGELKIVGKFSEDTFWIELVCPENLTAYQCGPLQAAFYIDLLGPTGPKGADGAPGPQGPQGSEGPSGPQGLNGADGEPGPVGPMGPEGQVGPKGDTGPEGAPGKPASNFALWVLGIWSLVQTMGILAIGFLLLLGKKTGVTPVKMP